MPKPRRERTPAALGAFLAATALALAIPSPQAGARTPLRTGTGPTSCDGGNPAQVQSRIDKYQRFDRHRECRPEATSPVSSAPEGPPGITRFRRAGHLH